jgi:hypothetical protein
MTDGRHPLDESSDWGPEWVRFIGDHFADSSLRYDQMQERVGRIESEILQALKAREDSEKRMVRLDERASHLEQRVSRGEESMRRFGDELKKNTETTDAIKSDTAFIISLMRGSRMLMRFLSWLSPVAAAAAAVAAYWAVKR